MEHGSQARQEEQTDAAGIIGNNLCCLFTTRNHLIYDETNSSQIAEKMSQNNIYDSFMTILDNVME